MILTEKTTASLQTPPGKGGIALISLCGPDTTKILQRIFQPRKNGATLPAPDELQLGFLMDGNERLDEVIISLTPETAEINIHGGSGIAHRAMKLLAECGVEVSTPHSASFHNAHPRWNNPVIGAEMLDTLATSRSLKVVQAVSLQWSDGLSRIAGKILDNPQDGSTRSEELRAASDGFATMQKLLNPMEVVLAGPPNTGKSTLANAIVARPVSIVHDHAGTTRDWIREQAIIRGIPIWCTDTAGLWTTDHVIDAEAVRRAWDKIEQADLVVLVSTGDPIELPKRIHTKNILHVETKSDIRTPSDKPISSGAMRISALMGVGMETLGKEILKSLGLDNFDPTVPRAFTSRQVKLLNITADTIDAGDYVQAKAHLRELLGAN